MGNYEFITIIIKLTLAVIQLLILVGYCIFIHHFNYALIVSTYWYFSFMASKLDNVYINRFRT